MKKHKNIIITLSIILSVVVTIVAGCGIYVSIYYHSDDVSEYLKNDENLEIIKSKNRIDFVPNEYDASIVFYPGGKVEYTSYVPLLRKVAEKNIKVVLVKMPFNLAVFDINRANKVIDDKSDWYIMGHSLGGAMGAEYASKNYTKLKGVILLAAYSTTSLKDKSLKTLTIYGSCDKVLNLEKLEKNKVNLDEGTKIYVIEGGCHSFFGNYGIQKGDGNPTVTREEQQELTSQYIASFIK